MVIGIGNKARQGKDTLATYMKKSLKEKGKESVVLHWADKLYEEVKNNNRGFPLMFVRGLHIFFLVNANGTYVAKHKSIVPEFKEFLHSQSGLYWGMDEKDSVLLQLWGTNFRRKFYGEDYWINTIQGEIFDCLSKQKIVIVPDTRFLNEYKFVNQYGFYINIMRFHKNNQRWVDPTRDSLHLSEVTLDGIHSRYEVRAFDEDLETIQLQGENIVRDIIGERK